MSEIDWSQSHCGVYLCTYEKAVELMPEIVPILNQLHEEGALFWKNKLIDVKVHMLMPKQFPCIPNWHCDFRPRDAEGQRDEDAVLIINGAPMYIWTSGPPYTEFIKDGKITKAVTNEWHSFTQNDWHRGTVSDRRCWRCFIRVIPAHFAHAAMQENVGQQRRHCQVYLDAADFNW